MLSSNLLLLLALTTLTTPDPLGAVPTDEKVRRHAVPVLYVRGSHYDIGYDVGRTFSAMIQDFVDTCERLQDFLREYETPNGKTAYQNTLANMRGRFPWYVREIQGVADGAKVPFHKLFLLQMDDIIETVNENANGNNTSGCSSIGVKDANSYVLGHTEDAFSETLNHFYILHAHVVPTAEDLEAGAREERFASLCYAGHMPGYTMGFNHHGLVFSINTLSPKKLIQGNTPRTFITRSLLGATDFADVKRIVTDKGLGAANGCSLNVIFDTADGRSMHNIEMAPNYNAFGSALDIREYKADEFLVHCNKYMRLKVEEVGGAIINSSNQRLVSLGKYSQPHGRADVMKMLSDRTGPEFNVFENGKEAVVRTIAAGIFDLAEGTWSIYIDKPAMSEPVAVLPIFSKKPTKK